MTKSGVLRNSASTHGKTKCTYDKIRCVSELCKHTFQNQMYLVSHDKIRCVSELCKHTWQNQMFLVSHDKIRCVLQLCKHTCQNQMYLVSHNKIKCASAFRTLHTHSQCQRLLAQHTYTPYLKQHHSCQPLTRKKGNTKRGG